MLSLLSKCRFQSVQPVLKISLTIFPISKLDKVEPDTVLLTLGNTFGKLGLMSTASHAASGLKPTVFAVDLDSK